MTNPNPPSVDDVRSGLLNAIRLFPWKWVEWGVIECIYARSNPDHFTALLSDRWHTVQGVRDHATTSGGDSVSEHLSLRVLGNSKQSDAEKARKRPEDGPATGYWAAAGRKKISYWTLASGPAPELESIVTWDAYCAPFRLPTVNIGMPWDLYFMSYVPSAE
jgi:hypothetical protein